MALRDCIPVEGADEEDPEWSRWEEPAEISTLPHLQCTIGLEFDAWVLPSRSHYNSQTSDYFSDTSSPRVLSRSVSLSNVIEPTELDVECSSEVDGDSDDIGPEEDEGILKDFQATKSAWQSSLYSMYTHNV